jgi:hypothetical protein
MNEAIVEVLKALGYPLGSVVIFIVLAYMARQFFQKLLESVVARDLEAIKAQNAENLEAVKKEYSLVLESRKAELAQEIERFKSSLSVEAETRRLAAQKRFDVLLDLWQSSESLLRVTDFRKIKSIKASLSQIDVSLSHLRRCSVLLSPKLLDNVEAYLVETAKVLTTSEEELQKKEVDYEKEKKVEKVISKAISLALPLVASRSVVAAAAFGLAGGLSSLIVPSIKKTLEKLRYKRAESARVKLEEVIRQEFGVPTESTAALLTGGNEETA